MLTKHYCSLNLNSFSLDQSHCVIEVMRYPASADDTSTEAPRRDVRMPFSARVVNLFVTLKPASLQEEKYCVRMF